MLVKVSWNNIWRNKTRSLVLVSSIMLGIWAGVFIMGFYSGLIDQRITSAIEKEVSHIQLHHKKFSDEKLIKYFIPNSSSILSDLQNIDSVKSVSGRIKLQGMLASPKNSTGIQINGIIPEMENSVNKLEDDLQEGTFFSKYKKNAILISRKLADKLNVKIKSKLVLTFQDINNEIVYAAFKVEGIFKTSNGMFDEMNVFVKAKDVKRILKYELDFHEIAILLDKHENQETVFKKVQDTYPNLLVENWFDVIPGMKFMMESMDTTLYVILWIIMLALLFGIINTMLMAVLERTREIGMLMAIGMNKIRIFFMILIETVFLLLMGGPLGLILASFTINHFGVQGIDLSIVAKGLEEFGYASIIYPALETEHYINVLMQVIAMAFLGSIYPAVRALKLKPSEVVK